MKSLKQYSIPHTGLKIGHHQFSYEVGGSFFDEFEYSLVKNGALSVELSLEKQETLMVLDFRIWGTLQVNCDRCLSDFPYQIDTADRLIAKFSESDDLSDAEEVVVLGKNDVEIDVSSFIYEIINLAAPYVNLCEDPGNTSACDQETLEKLKELSVSEENSESKDPRWDILKSIKKN
ncbi:DUF177 domain-containing protein [Pedobacter sp. SD-b]|uniref:DUF177 domain-containing protein n=1 Tax=Pedobacter segetis TaxID=2793069 RepID=A0ABS1BN64_9SPHI|nr:DUF177 domain-containing protein [Pedobacter segetis]MBK0384301.1 DUF177 domain-containing protein [Pedobacter segetis]